MSTYETITFEQDNGVGWVTLDRPEVHNAFNEQMQRELSSLWQALRGDTDVRCVVVTGAGDKAFCTGIDRSEVPDDGVTVFDPWTWDDPGDQLGPKSNQLFTPVIAAVNGLAAAGAFYLLGEVEFIIAADHATFLDPHVTFGMSAVYEPAAMMPRMPYGEIARLTLLGSHERMTAARAHQVGLVSEVVPADGLRDAARWAAEAIASQPFEPLRTTVQAMWHAREWGRRALRDAAPSILQVGTSPAALAEGQETFRSGARIEPRLR